VDMIPSWSLCAGGKAIFTRRKGDMKIVTKH
jgi:hypothetical protein